VSFQYKGFDAAVVMTNYNNTSDTVAAVASLESQIGGYKVLAIVIDNASAEADREELKELEASHALGIKVIYNEKNIGYFSGLNLGLQFLHEIGILDQLRFVVVGNNDLMFPENFVDAVLRSDSLSKYPVVSPDILTLTGDHQNPHVVSRISKLREMIYTVYYSSYFLSILIKKLSDVTNRFSDRKDESQHGRSQEIYQGYGACYLLSRSFFDEFRLLDSPTFMMFEEFFLSLQLKRKGYSIFYDSTISITHRVSGSVGKISGRRKWQLAHQSFREYRKYIGVTYDKFRGFSA
jgi:GT2 family glycosyltransferase